MQLRVGLPAGMAAGRTAPKRSDWILRHVMCLRRAKEHVGSTKIVPCKWKSSVLLCRVFPGVCREETMITQRTVILQLLQRHPPWERH